MNVAYFQQNLRRHFPGAPYCLDTLCTMAARGGGEPIMPESTLLNSMTG